MFPFFKIFDFQVETMIERAESQTRDYFNLKILTAHSWVLVKLKSNLFPTALRLFNFFGNFLPNLQP